MYSVNVVSNASLEHSFGNIVLPGILTVIGRKSALSAGHGGWLKVWFKLYGILEHKINRANVVF